MNVVDAANYPVQNTTGHWEVNYDGLGWNTVDESAANPVYATSVQLRYVLEGDCDMRLVSDVAYYNVALFRDQVTMPENDEVYCVGDQITLADGSVYTVNNDAQFSQTVPYDYFNLGQEPYYAERTYNYDLHVYNIPTVVATATATELTAGESISAYLPQVTVTDAASNPTTAANQYWMISIDGAAYQQVDDNPIIGHNAQLKYVVESSCGSNAESNIVALTIKKYIGENREELNVCPGEQITTTSGQVITANRTMDYTDVMPFDKFNVGTTEYADSITYYSIVVLQDPTFDLVDIPMGICGEPLQIIDPTYNSGDDVATVESLVWQLRDANGNYNIYNGEEVTGSDAVVRFVATTGCGKTITSDPMTVILQTPQYTEDDVQIGVQKYNWLLLIDKLSVEQQYGITLEESNITWYKVAGEADYLGNEGNDENLGHGYYYTTDHSLTGTGDYYAVIDVPARFNTCGALFYSQIFSFSSERQPVRLLTSMLTRNDDVTVINLDEETESEVRILNMMGQTIYQTRTLGSNTLTLPAQQTGHYMVRIDGGNNQATLKFIVK